MSNELFQILCPNCDCKLNAKTSLIGQTRNCPKCGQPVLIVLPNTTTVNMEMNTAGGAAESGIVLPPLENQLGPQGILENLPTRLEFQNRYLILNPDRVIAIWETGKGWQINVGNGFASAKKNVAAIPDQGTFAFVELVIGKPNAEGLFVGGPRDLHVFQISARGALTSLYRDDNEILNKIDRPTFLNIMQKSALSNYLRQQFMGEALLEADAIFAALSM